MSLGSFQKEMIPSKSVEFFFFIRMKFVTASQFLANSLQGADADDVLNVLLMYQKVQLNRVLFDPDYGADDRCLLLK